MGLLGNIAGLLEAAALTCEPGKRGLARQRIAQFAQSTTGPAWPNLDRVGVAQRLRELVDDPQLVNQGHLGVCAVAVFLRCWIQRDPLAFVNFAATLYETGTATLGSLTIKPNATLIAQNYDALQDGLWIDDFWGGPGGMDGDELAARRS